MKNVSLYATHLRVKFTNGRTQLGSGFEFYPGKIISACHIFASPEGFKIANIEAWWYLGKGKNKKVDWHKTSARIEYPGSSDDDITILSVGNRPSRKGCPPEKFHFKKIGSAKSIECFCYPKALFSSPDQPVLTSFMADVIPVTQDCALSLSNISFNISEQKKQSLGDKEIDDVLKGASGSPILMGDNLVGIFNHRQAGTTDHKAIDLSELVGNSEQFRAYVNGLFGGDKFSEELNQRLARLKSLAGELSIDLDEGSLEVEDSSSLDLLPNLSKIYNLMTLFSRSKPALNELKMVAKILAVRSVARDGVEAEFEDDKRVVIFSADTATVSESKMAAHEGQVPAYVVDGSRDMAGITALSPLPPSRMSSENPEVDQQIPEMRGDDLAAFVDNSHGIIDRQMGGVNKVAKSVSNQRQSVIDALDLDKQMEDRRGFYFNLDSSSSTFSTALARVRKIYGDLVPVVAIRQDENAQTQRQAHMRLCDILNWGE